MERRIGVWLRLWEWLDSESYEASQSENTTLLTEGPVNTAQLYKYITPDLGNSQQKQTVLFFFFYKYWANWINKSRNRRKNKNILVMCQITKHGFKKRNGWGENRNGGWWIVQRGLRGPCRYKRHVFSPLMKPTRVNYTVLWMTLLMSSPRLVTLRRWNGNFGGTFRRLL